MRTWNCPRETPAVAEPRVPDSIRDYVVPSPYPRGKRSIGGTMPDPKPPESFPRNPIATTTPKGGIRIRPKTARIPHLRQLGFFQSTEAASRSLATDCTKSFPYLDSTPTNPRRPSATRANHAIRPRPVRENHGDPRKIHTTPPDPAKAILPHQRTHPTPNSPKSAGRPAHEITNAIIAPQSTPPSSLPTHRPPQPPNHITTEK